MPLYRLAQRSSSIGESWDEEGLALSLNFDTAKFIEFAKVYMPKTQNKSEIYLGMGLMGMTGLAMGWVVHSPLLMTIAGLLGLMIGGFVGWLGGRRYMVIICLGVLVGAVLGYRTGDRDILIIAAGSGGAIAGFMGAQIEQFFHR